MRPVLTQKCDRHPVLRQTEGRSDGLPAASTSTSHLGLASSSSISSIVSALIRMIDTGNYPTAIMINHGTGGRKWHKAAEGIPGYWRPKDDLNAESFAFELLHDPTSRDEGFPRKIGADAWFDNWAAEKYDITEQSFRIKGEGVITILTSIPR